MKVNRKRERETYSKMFFPTKVQVEKAEKSEKLQNGKAKKNKVE